MFGYFGYWRSGDLSVSFRGCNIKCERPVRTIGLVLDNIISFDCWPYKQFYTMADDLASFIESQKRKLEKERAEILRAQESEVRLLCM